MQKKWRSTKRSTDKALVSLNNAREYQKRKARKALYADAIKARKLAKEAADRPVGIIIHKMDEDPRHREACQRQPRPGIQSGLG